MTTKAFFFDRDGIVNVRIIGDYVKKVEDFKMVNDFAPLLKMVKEAGYLAILITNQQGIGKRLMTADDLAKIHNYMQNELLDKVNFCFDDIYFAPDLDGEGSYRRKPKPGMFFEAIMKWNIDGAFSFNIGDDVRDMQAGREAGLTNIFIGAHTKEELPEADYVFQNLKEAREFLEGKI